MEKKIIVAFILGAIISSVVGVIAANTISSSSVLYKNDKTVNTVLDELFENVDAIESDNTRLTSLEGRVSTLSSTHSSDITRIDNNITGINSKIGSTDISSIGDGTITGGFYMLNNILNDFIKSSILQVDVPNVKAKEQYQVSIPIEIPNGYKYLGVGAIANAHYGQALLFYSYNNGALNISFFNNYGIDLNTYINGITATIYYIKNV